MKQLLNAFLDLPTWEGSCIVVTTFLLLFLSGVAIAYCAYVMGIRNGERHAEFRFNRIMAKRRELSSIQL